MDFVLVYLNLLEKMLNSSVRSDEEYFEVLKELVYVYPSCIKRDCLGGAWPI
jgi:hypothetical protein